MILVAKQRRPTVSIRKRINNQTLIAFSVSLTKSVGLEAGQPVLVYLDKRMLKFKVKISAKDDLEQARRFVQDGGSDGVLVSVSGLEPKKFPPGKYNPVTTEPGWITIDLDAPRKP